METKICSKCKRELPKDRNHYHKDKNRKDGFTYDCKECKGMEFTDYPEHKKGYKYCNTCKSELPLTDDFFYKSKSKLTGYRSNCKDCENKMSETYNKENPQFAIDYYNANKEDISIKHKIWLEENKEYRAKQRLMYYNMNKKKILAYGKKYREENKEKLMLQGREWRQNNTELIRVSKQRRKANKKELASTLTVKQWQSVLKEFNYSCAYCGISEEQHKQEKNIVLHQEHFVALSEGGEYTHNNIIPSCGSCNSSKCDKDFFKWYPIYKYYDKDREKKILKYLGYIEEKQQLALF